MFLQQKIFAVLTSFSIFAGIIYLIKKGELKEEYSWLWFLTGLVLTLLVLWYDLLLLLTRLIGAVTPTTTLFTFGIIFLLLFLPVAVYPFFGTSEHYRSSSGTTVSSGPGRRLWLAIHRSQLQHWTL